jgi:riboflavin kinase/FMN adenylyltransferase
LAIGSFDGVHRGHQAIIRAARRAAADSRPVVALTFWPHPTAVLRPQQPVALLTDLPERVRLLLQAGADQVRVVRFSRRLAAWTPAQFVAAVLDPLHPATVVVGENFRFGRQAAADGRALAGLAGGAFTVEVLALLSDQGPVSSSRVRAALAAGDPGGAAQMLGRWFRYSGVVVPGDRRGRALGFPTANLAVDPGRACPADGVYAGWLTPLDAPAPAPRPGRPVEARRWPAANSVGTNPTYAGSSRRVEAHVLDRTDLELYGRPVGVDFVARLRGARRFDSPAALVEQLGHDIASTRRALSG